MAPYKWEEKCSFSGVMFVGRIYLPQAPKINIVTRCLQNHKANKDNGEQVEEENQDQNDMAFHVLRKYTLHYVTASWTWKEKCLDM